MQIHLRFSEENGDVGVLQAVFPEYRNKRCEPLKVVALISMPTKFPYFVAFLLLAATGLLPAGEPKTATQRSPEFERLKSLVGAWKGNTDMGQGSVDFTVEYRLVSGGSAIEERIFAGTPKEMVTMYYDRHGKLGLTHYCALGNRPGMILQSSSARTLKFDFDPQCGVDEKSEMHMHALTLTFEDADTITQDWTLFEGGKAKESHPFTLKRAKL
jgi:hypothetical protein